MVKVPSPPFALKARPRPESNPAPSAPGPTGGAEITFIGAISVTAIILLLHTEKSFLFLVSIAKPEGPAQGASEGRQITPGLAASISTTSLVFSMLAYSLP